MGNFRGRGGRGGFGGGSFRGGRGGPRGGGRGGAVMNNAVVGGDDRAVFDGGRGGRGGGGRGRGRGAFFNEGKGGYQQMVRYYLVCIMWKYSHPCVFAYS